MALPESSVENGVWFVHDSVMHRAAPGVGFIFMLNTIEAQQARHRGPDGQWGDFHSSLCVMNEEEAVEHGRSIERYCEVCFPEK